MEAKSNSRLSSSATAGLGHGHKHKDEASELVSDGGGHLFFSESLPNKDLCLVHAIEEVKHVDAQLVGWVI